MKQIENKETAIKNVDSEGHETGFCHYSDLIAIVIKRGKQGGLNYEDIENRLAIGKAIKEANGEIKLEDAEFKYLQKLVKEMTWPTVHEDLLKFRDDFK